MDQGNNPSPSLTGPPWGNNGSGTAGFPVLPPELRVPTVTAEQMREVDRAMVEDLGIELLQMMENAGRSLAEVALRRFAPSRVTVLAGRGGNGGGGLAAARHLANRGAGVTVVLSHPPEEMSPAARRQLDIISRMGVHTSDEPLPADLIVDALIGYSLRGDPRSRARALIEWATGAGTPVLSLDTPSGLDVDTGRASQPCVRAGATLTLALPKPGLVGGSPLVGDLYLADISVPAIVYERLGLQVPRLFGEGPIVELVVPGSPENWRR
ncbi:MAG: NAD(P)H-hydrate epimerase [Acidimicrobiales bacterium]